MFNPDGCFCCEPPEDPCVLSGCTWSSTEMSDADLTSGVTYHNSASGSTPDGTYEVTNVQDTSTGNDAPCRKITIETAVAPSKAESVYAICWKDNATHNPSTQCPLTNVSFCVESKRHGDSDFGLTDGVVFVIRQGGKVYATATQSVGVNWKRASGTYTSASFTWVNGTGNPNFTATGTAIEFGFALKLSVPKDGTPYDVVMFDNLCVTKRATCLACDSCDQLYTGGASDLAFISEASNGTGSLLHSHSIDSTDGLPSPSHKFTYTPIPSSGWTSPPAGVFDVYELPELYQPQPGCLSYLEFWLCYLIKLETDGYNPSGSGIGPNFSANPVVIQGGKVYQYGASPIVSGLYPGADALNWKKLTFYFTLRSFYEITGYFFAANPSLSYYTGRTTVGGGQPDLSQPFRLGIITRAQVASDPITHTSYALRAWIDNICLSSAVSHANYCAGGTPKTIITLISPSLYFSYSGGDPDVIAARAWLLNACSSSYVIDVCKAATLDSMVFGSYRYTVIFNPFTAIGQSPGIALITVQVTAVLGPIYSVGVSNNYEFNPLIGPDLCDYSNTANWKSFNVNVDSLPQQSKNAVVKIASLKAESI